MANLIKLKKGFDIKLQGEASKQIKSVGLPKTFAVKPADFRGIIPKLKVDIGSEVKAGTPLFYSKDNPDINFVSPVSGEVIEINRGAKRVILDIKILADAEIKHEKFSTADPANLSKEEVISKLLAGGCWPLIRQRPFHKVANPADSPKSIFVSGFDSAPLAVDYQVALAGKESYFQAGITALGKLTTGKVHLNLSNRVQNSAVFTNVKGAQINYFDGPHPAGNVGVQIHHIDPINKGDIVWIVNAQDVAAIGKLFTDGVYDSSRVIALAGSEVKNPSHVNFWQGASVESLLEGEINAHSRVISGNVLTGSKIDDKNYLGFYDQTITVIPEGDEPEFLGWLIPTYPRPSLSKTFLSYLFKDRKYKVNTSYHGEERALVVTGEYEKVLPMDVLPMQLIKAIMAGDVEAMETLGILEVAEEDLALCEFICTSKTEIQDIIREGLELMEKEG